MFGYNVLGAIFKPCYIWNHAKMNYKAVPEYICKWAVVKDSEMDLSKFLDKYDKKLKYPSIKLFIL